MPRDDIVAMPQERRYFFDVSSLREYVMKNDAFSGIQRVVAEIIPRFGSIHGAGRVYLSWLDKETAHYRCLPLSRMSPGDFKSPMRLRSFFLSAPMPEGAPYPLARYAAKPLKHLYYRTRLDIASALKDKKLFRRFGTTVDDWQSLRRNTPPWTAVAGPALETSLFASEVSPGDGLIVLDSSWEQKHSDIFKAASRQGVHVYVLVHDLIPILFPETTGGNLPEIFAEWLINSPSYTDTYLANSESTRRDLESFLKHLGQQKPVVAVPLAQEIVFNKTKQDGKRRDGLLSDDIYEKFASIAHLRQDLRKLAASDFALCVGTIEGRKNVWRIAAAWKMLIDEGYYDRLPKLIFAGRLGCLRSDFDELMKGTGNIYGYAHIVEGPSDVELDLLYRRCRFFVNASLCEGWGLPVGEGLSYGKTGVVSDSSSLPEVGGQLVEYCSPTSVASIADAVRRLASDNGRQQELETKIKNTQLRTWGDVAEQLAEVVSGLEGQLACQSALAVS